MNHFDSSTEAHTRRQFVGGAARTFLGVSLLNHLKGTQVLPVPEPGEAEPPGRGPDLAQVKGQETAKRALEIAAAGGHNLLFAGPPGTGKTMLASRLPGILPPLSEDDALEVAAVRSVCGLALEADWGQRPFRQPHHSASAAALVGGGSPPRPEATSPAS